MFNMLWILDIIVATSTIIVTKYSRCRIVVKKKIAFLCFAQVIPSYTKYSYTRLSALTYIRHSN